MYGPSLYDSAEEDDMPSPDPEERPKPGTSLTASVETIDNDREELTLAAGIVR